VDRLLHYYAHTAQKASVPIARNPRAVPNGPAPPHAPALPGPESVRTWLRTEQPSLEAAFTHARTHGLDGHAISLAAGLAEILLTDGPWTRALDIRQTAADTADRLSEPAAHAYALTNLGHMRQVTGDCPGACDALTRALEIYDTLGNRGNKAWALNYYAATLAASGQRPRALALYQQALAMNHELNKPDDEAASLEGIAEHYLATGDPAQGTAYLHRVLEIYQRLGMAPDTHRVQNRLTGRTAR
jgi:tetratricopeptide (TPR) repeat protein